MGSDVDCQMSSACRTLILCVAADRGLDRGDFPEPAEGADAWSEPAQGQPTVLQTGDYNVLICGNSNRNPRSGHVSGRITGDRSCPLILAPMWDGRMTGPVAYAETAGAVLPIRAELACLIIPSPQGRPPPSGRVWRHEWSDAESRALSG